MKLDLYKTCKAEYATPRQPVKLGVKPAHYLVLSGLRAAARVHELYLSDPRRVAPAKLRTILRLPVK